MAAVFGRRYQTVQKWGSGHLTVPRPVLEQVLDRCTATRFSADLRRTLAAAAEHEHAKRMEGVAGAARWLRLILDQQRKKG